MNNSTFVKQVLVEQGELDRLRQRQFRDFSPEIQSMIALQEQIVKTLLRTDIDPQTKLQLVSGPQSRFDRLKEETNTLNGASTSAASSESNTFQATKVSQPNPEKEVKQKQIKPESDADPESSVPLLDIVSLGIRKNYKERAKQFLDELASKKSDVISRNDQNELVVNGTVVPKSNFNKLYTAMFTPNGSANMIGMPEFLNGLRQLHVPIDNIVSVPIKKAYATPIARTGPLHKHEPAIEMTTASAAAQLKQEPDQSKSIKNKSSSTRKKVKKEELSSSSKQTGHGIKPIHRILYVY